MRAWVRQDADSRFLGLRRRRLEGFGTDSWRSPFTGHPVVLATPEWAPPPPPPSLTSSPQQAQWTIAKFSSFATESSEVPGVVGMAVNNTHKALLVARDHVDKLFVDFEDDNDRPSMEVPLPNKSSIVQLVTAGATGTAVALLREGSLYSVHVHNRDAPQRVTLIPIATDISPPTDSDVAAGKWSDSLKTVDLYCAWKSQFAENKNKREEEKSATEERNKSNPKTNGNNKKK